MSLCRRMGTVIPILHEMRKGGKGLIIGDFIVFLIIRIFCAGYGACGFKWLGICKRMSNNNIEQQGEMIRRCSQKFFCVWSIASFPL